MITTGDIKYNFKLAANRLDELHEELEATKAALTKALTENRELLEDYARVHTGRLDMDMAYAKLQKDYIKLNSDHDRLKASHETVVKGQHKVNTKTEEKKQN